MRDIVTKQDNIGDRLSASDFNSMSAEMENAALSADISLDPAGGPDSDLFMLAQTMAGYANAASTYKDTGSANAKVLTTPSNLRSVAKYYDGMKITFKSNAANSGASTVNINALGVKDINDKDGAALVLGAILAGQYYVLIYNDTSGYFELMGPGAGVVDGDLEVTGHMKANSFEGVGTLLTGVPSAGVGGSSSESSLTLMCNSADGEPLSKIVASKFDQNLFELDENGFMLNTGIPYSHEDDIIPFDKPLDFQGHSAVRDQGQLNQTIRQYAHFNGVSGNCLVADHASYSGMFEGPTTYIFEFNPDSYGETNQGTFLQKLHHLQFRTSTGYIEFYASFSGSIAQWRSVDGMVIGKDTIGGLVYDGSDVLNVPVLYIDGVPVLMEEIVAPIGTILTDVGSDLYFGNRSADDKTFHGNQKKNIILNYGMTPAQLEAITSNPQMALDRADESGSNVAQNVSNCVNSGVVGYDTFSGASATGFTAIKTTSVGNQLGGTANELILEKGKRYIALISNAQLSGTEPEVNIRSGDASTEISEEGAQTVENGSNALIFTATETTTGMLQYKNSDGELTNYTISNQNFHQLGATLHLPGENIVSEQDGTAVTWFDQSGNGNNGSFTNVKVGNRKRQQDEVAGTFTPDAVFSGGNGDLSYDDRAGSFTKTGRRVFISGYLRFDQATASGNFSIGSLPYVAKTQAFNNPPVALFLTKVGAASNVVMAYIVQGTQNIEFFLSPQDNSSAFSSLTDSEIGASNVQIYFSGSYETDE